MGIPAGMMITKIGYKKTALVALALGFIGVAVQYGSSTMNADAIGAYVVYLLGAFIYGFCVCILNTVVNPMLNLMGGGGNKGNQLIQIGGSLNSLAATLTPMLAGAMIGEITKDTSMGDVSMLLIIAMAIFAASFVIIYLTKIEEPETEKSNVVEGIKGALKYKHLVLGIIAIFFYVGIEVGIPNTANLYMSGLPTVGPAIAGTVVGVYWFLMLVGRLIGASIGAKVSSKAMMIAVSALGIALMLGIIYTPETTLVTIPIVKATVPLGMFFMALAGLCTSVMWGAIFNLSTEGLGKYTPMASGIFMALVCGGGIVPFLQNLLADSVGSLNSYWLLIGCLAYLLFYALVGCKNVNKDIPVE
jgi:FHS family L-fucose permease-like MFS transporter